MMLMELRIYIDLTSPFLFLFLTGITSIVKNMKNVILAYFAFKKGSHIIMMVRV